MLKDLIIVGIAGLIVSLIDMDAKFKRIAYIIIGVAVVLILLPLLGISI